MKHVTEFVAAAEAVWVELDAYEDALASSAREIELDRLLRKQALTDSEGVFELEHATADRLARIRRIISERRYVLGAQTAMRMAKTAGLLRLRWTTSLASSHFLTDALPEFDQQLDDLRLDAVGARELALARVEGTEQSWDEYSGSRLHRIDVQREFGTGAGDPRALR